MAASHIILIVAQQNADEKLCNSESIMIVIKISERNHHCEPLLVCIYVWMFDRKYYF